MKNVNQVQIKRDKQVEKLKINQIKTAENIIRVREEKKYSQTKVANEMGISRTHYCNIENGNRDITKEYLKRLADFFKVDYDDLAVYEEDYSKGFYDGLEYLRDFLDEDYLGLKSLVFNFVSAGDKLKHNSLLYPFLYSLGYEVFVLDSCDVWKEYNHPVPDSINENGEVEYTIPDVYDFFREKYVYLIVKDGKGLTYCSPSDFKRFEKLVQDQVDVYFNNSFKHFIYKTCTYPHYDAIEHNSTTLIDELKKQISDIKEYINECEKMIDREEKKRAKSERDGDDLQAKG